MRPAAADYPPLARQGTRSRTICRLKIVVYAGAPLYLVENYDFKKFPEPPPSKANAWLRTAGWNVKK
jgi:hypothetical protein